MQKGHSLAALILGIIELVVGLIVIICSFVLSAKAKLPTTLTPYWAAIPYMIPGILGIVTGITKNKCSMIAFMVLNIICLVLCGIGTILVALIVSLYAAFSGEVAKRCHTTGPNQCTCEYNGQKKVFDGIDDCDVMKTITGLLYTIVSFLVIALIVTFASSILGCIASCCSKEPAQTVIVQTGGVPMQGVNQPVDGGNYKQ